MKRRLSDAERKRLEARGAKITAKEQTPEYDVLGAALAGVAREMESRIGDLSREAVDRAQESFHAALTEAKDRAKGEARTALEEALSGLREAVERDRKALVQAMRDEAARLVAEIEVPTPEAPSLPMPSSVAFEYDANGFTRTLVLDTGERFEVEFNQNGRPRKLVPVTH